MPTKTTIASARNPRLRALRRLQTRRGRSQSGNFMAEGEDLIAAASAAGCEALDGYRLAGSEIGGDRFCDVEPATLATVSTLGSGTRAIGVYRQRWSDAAHGPLCVYLHGVGDPGNVGAVLRAAHAFGASCVALGPGCADPHSPKAVRASMGAIFGVEIAHVDGPDTLPAPRVALVAHAGTSLRKLAQSLAAATEISLLVGAERQGLAREVLGVCEHTAHIPIASDSLNAAMAATIGLYEMARAGEGSELRMRAS